MYSPESISNALIKVSGVKSKKGVYFVSYSSEHNLTAGENNVTFTKKIISVNLVVGEAERMIESVPKRLFY